MVIPPNSSGWFPKPSRFAQFWQGAESLVPATQNDIRASKSTPKPSVFPTFDFEMCFAPQRRALFRHLNSKSAPNLVCFVHFDLEICFVPQRRALFRVVRDRQFLTLLTSKCASRHNGLHFFHISTSKSGPSLVWFVHFDLEMCFAPQRHALFPHLNFQKRSEPGVVCTF